MFHCMRRVEAPRLVNWPMTAKMGHGTPTEDLHFDTAIARELFADPTGAFDKFDQEGLEQMATRAGRNGAAEAFLDKLWATLVSRLTSGATATFFLQCALDILAGATTEPPKPDLVAGIFQQLHAAGTKVQGKLPFGNNQVPAATSHGVRSVVQLPEAERSVWILSGELLQAEHLTAFWIWWRQQFQAPQVLPSPTSMLHMLNHVAKACRRVRRSRLSASRLTARGS
jgi:hypothetical protein